MMLTSAAVRREERGQHHEGEGKGVESALGGIVELMRPRPRLDYAQQRREAIVQGCQLA